jgi:hypothetical protein
MDFVNLERPFLRAFRLLDWVHIHEGIGLDDFVLFGEFHHKPERCQDVLLGLAPTRKVADEHFDFEAANGIDVMIAECG